MGRSGRGWGPFSGGQLTTMVCVIVAAVAFPVGAWAVVSGSNVFVTDATSGSRAAVSTSGAVSVAGGVTANNASPKNLFRHWGIPSAAYTNVGAPPAGKALVVTSIVIDTYSDPTPNSSAALSFVVSSMDATCAHQVQALITDVNPSGFGMTTIPFPSGVVIPAGRALCSAKTASIGVEIGVYGYLVAASAAPPGA
jgi:hypothetical protein